MSIYRQAIILFGAVIPLIIFIAVMAIGYMVKSKMNDTFVSKKETYQTNHRARLAASKVEQDVKKLRGNLERWETQLSRETSSEVSIILREISEKLPNKEIQRTSYEPSNSSGGFGNASAQPSSQIRMAFRGTYSTLQKALLELETRLPQLQLENLTMEPMKSSAALINLQVTYTAWEK